ncbi:MAG: TonB-dependent receptor [Saprospiraceae bacterium]|nr:TonB-dependent receptor [Saprospiraceae bacterium]
MKLQHFLILCITLLISTALSAQKIGGVRGSIVDEKTGEPMVGASVYLAENESKYNGASDLDGFYSVNNVPPGTYTLIVQYIGYDSTSVSIEIKAGKMSLQNLRLKESENIVGPGVNVSAEREAEKNEVRVSTIRITNRDITRLPSAGGEPDLAQYLQVIPGVISTGDQGGQLYIRGGAPIQNRILLDGMTIHNAFHSIGFFSVFETETIKSADVYTGGFSAKYGGRSSAIVDIKTRAGNRKRFAGLVSVNPFVAKGLFEGPLVKLKDEGGSSLSFLLTMKHSYLNETSSLLYSYANEEGVLPYNFTDGYGKLSFSAENGSRVDAFGFSYNDNVRFDNTLNYKWNAGGAGIDFRIVPGSANIIMDGNIAYSNYRSNFVEGDSSKERSSSINNFSVDLNFTYFMAQGREFNYGLEFNSLLTNFDFTNNGGIGFDQKQSNNEVAMYLRYRGRFGPIVIEPSFRAHFYASLGEIRVEPRIGFKYNITDFLRFKLAGGLYSQNLIASVDERDVVNLFVGFLGGPDESVFTASQNADGSIIYTPTKSKLQTSIHGVGGVEANVTEFAKVNVEGYWKYFPQIISLNRNAVTSSDPKYIAEQGSAYGFDLSTTFEKDGFYAYLAYSLGFVKRNDGIQEFFASFDRRHNMNIVASYTFGSKKKKSSTDGEPTIEQPDVEPKIQNPTEKPFEVSLRWNLGSGFPFTLTSGFFDLQNFQNGINTDFLTGNTNPGTELGVIYDDEINGGRLPYYHRLDLSFKYTLDLVKYMKLNIVAGVTNVYNRENIFYFDRIDYKRINQLPIMPSLSLSLKF